MSEAMTVTERTPGSVSELLGRLDHIEGTLPKRLRQCAEFLRGNANMIAVSTVAEVADLAGVAPSAFMRFCQALGFSGYSDMQALFRAEYSQVRPNYADRLSELRARGAADGGRLLADFVDAGHKSLVSLLNEGSIQQVDRVVGILSGAHVIHLLGLRRAFALTSYAGYMLQKMGVPAMLHGVAGGIESTPAMQRGDVLFATTFAPFSPETVSAAARAHAAGVRVILMTDTADCPVADFAEEVLIAREVEVDAFRVPTAGMTLMTTIVVALGGRRGAVNESVAPATKME